jgi:hypothetical protein
MHVFYDSKPIDLYTGTSLLTGGGILLVASLILIMTREIVRVLTDIRYDTFELARTAQPTLYPTPAQTAATSVQQDRRETRAATTQTLPIEDTFFTLSGELSALKVGQGMILLARGQGYAEKTRDTCVRNYQGRAD